MSFLKLESDLDNNNEDNEHVEEHDNLTATKSLVVNVETIANQPAKRTFLSSCKEILNMSSAIIVTRGFLILNNYGNSIILNRYDHNNSSDAAAAGALINTYNSMASASLFAVLAANYIKSIPMARVGNFEEVRENLLRSALLGIFILTPLGEIAFYFSGELFVNVMRSPINASHIATSYFRGYMPGLPCSILVNAIQQSMIGVGRPWFMVFTSFTQAGVSNLIGLSWVLDKNISSQEAASHLGYANSIAAASSLGVGLLILRCNLNDPYAFFSARGNNLLVGIWELVKVGSPVLVSVFTETFSIFTLAGFIGSLKGDNLIERQTHLAMLQASAIYLNFSSVSLIAVSQSCLALTRSIMTPLPNVITSSIKKRLSQSQLLLGASNLIGLIGVVLFGGFLCIFYSPATHWLLQHVELDELTLKLVLYVYLINNLFGQLIDSVRLISNGSLIGHGDLIMPTIINIFSLGIGLALGYLMGPSQFGIGILGPIAARQIGISIGAMLSGARLFQVRRNLRNAKAIIDENTSIVKTERNTNSYSPGFFLDRPDVGNSIQENNDADDESQASGCHCVIS